MSFSFIKNQAIPFNLVSDYYGMDNREYFCLKKNDDVLSFQMKAGFDNAMINPNPDFVLGSNLITNGTFTGSATGWTLGSGWTYGSNKVTHAGAGNNSLTQVPTILANAGYKVVFTVSGRTTGTLSVGLGGTSINGLTTNQTYEVYITTVNTGGLVFVPFTSFDGSIDNVFVYRTYYRFNGTQDWIIENNALCKTAGVAGTITTEEFSANLNQGCYKILITVSDMTAGLLTLRLPILASTEEIFIESNGSYIFYLYKDEQSDYFQLKTDSLFDGCITNFEVYNCDFNYAYVSFFDCDNNFIKKSIKSVSINSNWNSNFYINDNTLTYQSSFLAEGINNKCIKIAVTDSGGLTQLSQSFVDWTLGTGWGLNGFPPYDLVKTPGNTNKASSTISTYQNSGTYIVKVSVSAMTSGSLSIMVGGDVYGTSISADGDYEFTDVIGGTSNTLIELFPSTGFDGTVTSVEVFCLSNISGYLYTSECINVQSNYDGTLLLEWNNNKDALGFDYTSSASINHNLRVKGRIGRPNYPQERKDVLDSQFANTNIYAVSRKKHEIIIDEVPEYIHDAISVARLHNTFVINDYNYKAEADDYEVQDENNLNMFKSRFEATRLDTYVRLTNCADNNGVNGSDNVLLDPDGENCVISLE